MNDDSSLKIKEWYWINLKDFDGKPFGQILKKNNTKNSKNSIRNF